MHNTVFYGFAGKGYDSASLLENYLSIAVGSITYFNIDGLNLEFYTLEDFYIEDDFFFNNCSGISCLDDIVEVEDGDFTDNNAGSYTFEFI